MRLLIPRWFVVLTSVTLVGVTGGLVWWWLMIEEEQVVVRIVADRAVEVALPVYAQFVVTQRIQLSETARVSRLEVPLYLPSGEHSLEVMLLKDGRFVRSWALDEYISVFDAPDFVDVSFPLREIVELSGELEVRFDGRANNHEQLEMAPRVLVEKDDIYYPGGNYRVADNEKEGDVGLKLYEQKKRSEVLLARWQAKPLSGVIWVLRLLLILVLVTVLPFAVRRLND